MSPQLPFITKPKSNEVIKVGNSEIGELEISKLGDLSINERRYLKQQTTNLPNLQKEAVRMAETIAAKMDANLLDVYSALTSGDTAYLSDHIGAVLEFQDKMEQVTEERMLALATTILKFRLVPSWEPENTGDANLILPELVKEVAHFGKREEDGWAVEEPETAEPLTEEDLGKSETP